MSLPDIKQAIARHHPGFLESNKPQENYTSYVGIPRTLAVWSAGNHRHGGYRSDADEEYFEVALTLPPGDHKAFGISRMVLLCGSVGSGLPPDGGRHHQALWRAKLPDQR